MVGEWNRESLPSGHIDTLPSVVREALHWCLYINAACFAFPAKYKSRGDPFVRERVSTVAVEVRWTVKEERAAVCERSCQSWSS